MPLSGHDRTTAWIPERQLREYVLPQFRAAIRAGLRTVMVNSGDINGVPVHASHEMLTDLLRKELGFTGIAVSDWEDINKLVYMHRVAATPKDAVRMAVMAGIDMSMAPYNVDFARYLVELVREGAVPQSRIDEAVRRILRVKFELGLFENAAADQGMLANVGAPGFREASKAAAEEAVTLLRNERGLLPLAKTSRVLVTGPGATSMPAMYGSWSYTWQGTDTLMYPKDAKNFLAAIRGKVGAERVTYVPGATFDREEDIAAAANAARNADVAIVALAEFPSTETPGNIDDLVLPAAQLKLARAIEATGTPVVLTLFENRPRIIRDVVDSSRAVVTAYETGPFGGEAMAGVLFGDVNPSGRLPFSYPRFTGAIVPYDRSASGNMTASGPTGGYNPEWPFGHGLSYTTFAYSDLRVGAPTLGANDTLVVTLRLANSGSRPGKEVVQLYVRDLVASIAPPMQRLRAFQKIALGAGESKSITLRVPVQELAFIGLDNRPIVEPGEFEVMVGGQTAKFTVR
jgi:beta-glucosidase